MIIIKKIREIIATPIMVFGILIGALASFIYGRGFTEYVLDIHKMIHHKK